MSLDEFEELEVQELLEEHGVDEEIAEILEQTEAGGVAGRLAEAYLAGEDDTEEWAFWAPEAARVLQAEEREVGLSDAYDWGEWWL